MPDKLNLIVIIADTFRADYLGCDGNDWIQTPALDRLAADGMLFGNCFADGLPTIPERRVMFTGKSIIPMSEHGGWEALGEEVTLPQVLRQNGYTNAFFTDTYHYFRPGLANFHRAFDAWELIRGQEFDPWQSGPRENHEPREHMPEHLWNENYDLMMRQYMLNTQDIRTEEDYFCARTFRSAMRWLERNETSQPFMMWIDTFDPHEPWDAPKRFKDMYCDSYPVERYLFGYGVKHSDVREEDYPVLKALYAAEVSFVDMWIGRFLDRVSELGMDGNTIVAFSSDHGTHLGEEGCIQKMPSLLNSCVARLPLIIRHPDPALAGHRIDALVSSVDFTPTFMDMLGAQYSPDGNAFASYKGVKADALGLQTDGTSILDLATGKRDRIHDRVYSEFGDFAAVRDDTWHYFQHTRGEDPGKGPGLYHVSDDRAELHNVVAEHPDIVAAMRDHLAQRLGVDLPPVH